MANETVSQETQAPLLDDEMERRRRCLAAEHMLTSLGSHENSLATALRRILCAGQYVDGEGGSPERALLRWAALTTKALAIAISRSAPGDADEHDLVLYDHEAAVALGGLSEILTAAPRLIEAFDQVEIISPRHGGDEDEDGGVS